MKTEKKKNLWGSFFKVALAILLVVSLSPSAAFAINSEEASEGNSSSADLSEEGVCSDETEARVDDSGTISDETPEIKDEDLSSEDQLEPQNQTAFQGQQVEDSNDLSQDGLIASEQAYGSTEFNQLISNDDLTLDESKIVKDTSESNVFIPENTGNASNQISPYALNSVNGVPSVSYSTHVQTYGWQNPVNDGTTAGTTGEAKRLEGIKISVDGIEGLGIAYRTHVQKIGWQDAVYDGEMSGTSGQALRLEAIQIALTGSEASNYDIYYRVHAQHYGWLDWAHNGYAAGTSGYAYRLEAIQIVILPKGSEAPGSTTLPYLDGTYGSGAINYKTHVQTYGWQDWTWDGGLSGTNGQAKRLEGIRINTEWMEGLGVTYRTHVQKIGWQDWVSDGALSGTEGQALRLEAIQIKLTGEQAKNYDVYYRVHTQKYGWLGWAKNGESAGTSCHAFRLEQIQIVLTYKGSGAPSDSYGIPSAIEAYSTEEGQAMYNVNAWRSQYGLLPVTGDPLLHECAQIRSKELLTLFSHTRPNGTDCFTVADEVGCNLFIHGENIAAGFSDGYSAVNGWMTSDGHRANILNENNKYMGVGASYGGSYGAYWAQMFAGA